MKPLFLITLLLPLPLLADQFWLDPVSIPLWQNRYNAPVIAPHNGYALPGVFTHPPAAKCNSTDFHRNERVLINSTYPLQWKWTNVTENIIWDVYLVNEHWQKRLIFSISPFLSRLRSILTRTRPIRLSDKHDWIFVEDET